jgi:hypothetical protein
MAQDNTLQARLVRLSDTELTVQIRLKTSAAAW